MLRTLADFSLNKLLEEHQKGNVSSQDVSISIHGGDSFSVFTLVKAANSSDPIISETARRHLSNPSYYEKRLNMIHPLPNNDEILAVESRFNHIEKIGLNNACFREHCLSNEL